MASPVSGANYIIMENVETVGEDISARNLVVFPGVSAKFSHAKINVEENFVILGSLNLSNCEVVTKNLFNGYTGSLKDLQSMIGFTKDEIEELIKRVNK